MRLKNFALFLAAFLVLLPGARGAHTSARLLLAAEEARPGETVLAGVELKMDDGWHTYWKNSGASGMPTTIDWELPSGITAGPILWPLGEKKPEGDLTTYTYSGVVVLLVPLQLANHLPEGELQLKAKVAWLECDKMCLPGDATVQATLRISRDSKPSGDAALLAEWMGRVPQPDPQANARAAWEGPADGNLRSLVIEWTSRANTEESDFYPYASEGFEVQPETEPVKAGGGRLGIRKSVKLLSGEWPAAIGGVLVEGAGEKRTGIEVSLSLAEARSQSPGQPLWLMLIYAFIGGLILNIMPCVLPVISLKVLGFVNAAKESPAHVRKMGIIYAAGVLFSFIVLAGLVIGFKAAGRSAGWGMQFGNPQFIAALAVLITLVALNLFGVFEVNPGGRVMDAAGSLASRQGSAGAFFNGVLATILATPCTAPFLGAALGFAFLQPSPYIVLIFCVVALGLAAPYVLLSWNPRLLKFLPKPGAWMVRFKVAMGFPMLATAVWLASLLAAHYGDRAWWFGMFLVFVALAAWIFGEFIQRGSKGKGAAMVVMAVVLAIGYWFVLEKQIQWRNPPGEVSANSPASRPGGIEWQKWSPAALQEARAQRRPVLVDFTADWCLTCQANKKFAIEIPQVRSKLKEINAVALLGDYTRLPAEMTKELNRYGRAGVPLVLVYPPDPAAEPLVLPEALTPGIVLDALEKAASKQAAQ